MPDPGSAARLPATGAGADHGCPRAHDALLGGGVSFLPELPPSQETDSLPPSHEPQPERLAEMDQVVSARRYSVGGFHDAEGARKRGLPRSDRHRLGDALL